MDALNALLVLRVRTFGRKGELAAEEAALAAMLLALAQAPAPAPGWRRQALGGLLRNISTLVKCGGSKLAGDAPQVAALT